MGFRKTSESLLYNSLLVHPPTSRTHLLQLITSLAIIKQELMSLHLISGHFVSAILHYLFINTVVIDIINYSFRPTHFISRPDNWLWRWLICKECHWVFHRAVGDRYYLDYHCSPNNYLSAPTSCCYQYFIKKLTLHLDININAHLLLKMSLKTSSNFHKKTLKPAVLWHGGLVVLPSFWTCLNMLKICLVHLVGSHCLWYPPVYQLIWRLSSKCLTYFLWWERYYLFTPCLCSARDHSYCHASETVPQTHL